jgi:hypothetical protein
MRKITTITTKVDCNCEDWKKEIKTIQHALDMFSALGFDSTTKLFTYCPYCASKLHVTDSTTMEVVVGQDKNFEAALKIVKKCFIRKPRRKADHE